MDEYKPLPLSRGCRGAGDGAGDGVECATTVPSDTSDTIVP